MPQFSPTARVYLHKTTSLYMMEIGHVKHYQRSTNKSSNVID